MDTWKTLVFGARVKRLENPLCRVAAAEHLQSSSVSEQE